MSELHIHERLNKSLNILNGALAAGFKPETAFAQSDAIVTTMKILAALDQDIAKAEQEEKKEIEVKLEEQPDEQTCEAD